MLIETLRLAVEELVWTNKLAVKTADDRYIFRKGTEVWEMRGGKRHRIENAEHYLAELDEVYKRTKRFRPNPPLPKLPGIISSMEASPDAHNEDPTMFVFDFETTAEAEAFAAAMSWKEYVLPSKDFDFRCNIESANPKRVVVKAMAPEPLVNAAIFINFTAEGGWR